MGSRGFGPGRSSATPAGGGGGGLLTADNGLSAVGSNVQLGGGMIMDTAIDLNGSNLNFRDSGTGLGLFLNTTAGVIDMTTAAGAPRMLLNGGSGLLQLSGGTLNGSLDFDNGAGTIAFNTFSGLVFNIDVNPSSERVFILNSSGNIMFDVNDSVQGYSIGALGYGNNSILVIDDASMLSTLQAGGTTVRLALNGLSDQVDIFNSISNFNMSGNQISMRSGIVDAFIEVDGIADIIRLGNSGGNVGVQINGIAGFTGTVAAPTSITVNNGIVTNVT